LKGYKKVRGHSNTNPNHDNSIPKKDVEEFIGKFESYISEIKQKYSLKEKIPEDTVPVEVFSTKLSPSEAVVKYLKENKQKTYREIAVILKRDERGIWGSYRRSLNKLKAPFEIAEPLISIPLINLSDRRLSILEAVVLYLKEVVGKRGTEISRLLNKSPTTISTVYLRAKKKMKAFGGAKK
jgi:DNA-directed RNA polymerase specialized sigma24 family protein